MRGNGEVGALAPLAGAYSSEGISTRFYVEGEVRAACRTTTSAVLRAGDGPGGGGAGDPSELPTPVHFC
jgi:hypothetical protein